MEQAQAEIKVGLIPGPGGLEDRGQSQYAHEALQALADEGKINYVALTTPSAAQAASTLNRLAEEGYRVLVSVGEEMGEAMVRAARQQTDALFITADYAPPPEIPNMRTVVFDPERIQEYREQISSHIENYVMRGASTTWQRLRSRLLDWNSDAVLTPFLAILTALIIGAFVIAAFDPEVWAAFDGGVFAGLGAGFMSVFRAYSALFEGSLGNPVRIVNGFAIYFSTGDDVQLLRAIAPLMESLRIATPYIFTGLAVALGFRCGLFNIGAEGQYFVGGLASVFVGYAVSGLPWFIHLPLAVAAGFLGGAAYAAIAGFLKARTGAHEVINTIMLNYIAFRLADYLLQVGGPMARPGDNRPVSPEVLPTAYLPQFFPDSLSLRINAGLILAVVVVWLVWFLLFKTNLGFEIRTVGANPRAARTAGINVERNFITAMGLSGGLAGLAGAHDILGVTRYMPNAFSAGYGFDAIALALLGKSHPVGVLLASLLFGMLRAGAQRMQGFAAVPIDIISVLQGLIIVFIAAPELVRMLYRVRGKGKETDEVVITRGWGSV